ncbi:MAG TPA: thymidine phosphorylase, partial [Dongiaceae bacterium]
MLAPLVAACGGAVPMISGRGLGHTGGTLDKLDAIPGYSSTPDIGRFKRVVAEAGCAIIGQTADLAPADRRLYAIRDVTATVESIPLITASILSKKLAAGLEGLVMDVKFGSGAFMADYDRAVELAASIADVANGGGLPTVALLTDMNQVLGRTAGNALEVRECIDWLAGRGRDARLDEVTNALAGDMLRLGNLAKDEASARAALAKARDSGAAAERFQRMVAALGGPKDLMEKPAKHLAAAPVIRPVAPARAGHVASMDVRAIGLAIVALGGGRRRVEDKIDPRVGLTEMTAIGEEAGPSRPLCRVHAASEADADAAAAAIRAAVVMGEKPAAAALIRERLGRTAA